MNSICRTMSLLQLNSCKISITGSVSQIRWKRRNLNTPKLRNPIWYTQQDRVKYNEELTPENAAFIKEVVHEKFGPSAVISGIPTYNISPLKKEALPKGTWFPGCRRSGLIARKLGVIPQWTVEGEKFFTTLLQVVDNHVVRYIPPEDCVFKRHPKRRLKSDGKMGCLVVGAISSDPQMFTKSYCGLFKDSGVMPKQVLTRFPIHPEAAVTPGTPLTAAHFHIGSIVDVTGKTIDRGFQGVMKRWGFHGMPASHGQTKTHRRPGNIGAGGEKARVWPGKKMPGHMGNRTRTLRGLKIWRINYKYNVLYVTGQNIPGATNSIVFIHDTVLPLKRLKEAPPFPTYFPEDHEKPLPDEVFDEELFNFKNGSIMFEPTK